MEVEAKLFDVMVEFLVEVEIELFKLKPDFSHIILNSDLLKIKPYSSNPVILEILYSF